MSGLAKGRVLPKTGRELPTDTESDDVGSYASSIARALRRELGPTHQAIKTTMRWTGASDRTVKNWFGGAAGPSGEHLVALMKSSNEVWSAVLKLADRRSAGVGVQLLVARERLVDALKTVDALIDL